MELLGRPHVFERGDKVYLTTPLTLATPTVGEIEEFAFASAVKSKAPNDNIGWLSGRYVEAGKPNLNNAMWLNDELALKSLTPMLMPVTVMHDPRTAVGTIADCKLISEGAARIDTILAVWKHRFPDVWEEAAANLERGQLMQSMECFTPWYTCSECSQQYIKLPHGSEQASWCDHLRTNSGRRILGDVCFTGTGLIFGSQGGVGAYTEAYLDHFHEEIAEYHDRAHAESTYRPTSRSASQMGMVQIEESELATLRRERDEARRQHDELANSNRELTTKVERAEADKVKAEEEKAAAEKKATDLEQKTQRTELASRRISALGGGFLAKLGETSKARLQELASTCSDAQWDTELKEREELAGVQRNTAPEGGNNNSGNGNGGGNPPSSEATGFKSEEVAHFLAGGPGSPNNGNGNGSGAATPNGGTSVRQLARRFAKPTAATPAAK